MGKITARKKIEQAALPRLGLCQHRSPSLIDIDRLNERGKKCGDLDEKQSVNHMCHTKCTVRTHKHTQSHGYAVKSTKM
jgi:hypothetical protein